MSRRGNCWDNAPQESFFGHMKDEINLKDCGTFEKLVEIIDVHETNLLVTHFFGTMNIVSNRD